MHDKYRWITSLIMLFVGWGSVLAQDGSNVKILKTQDSINFDGIVNEDAWMRIDPLPLVQYKPVYKGEIVEKTEIRIAYDSEYLYVSGRMFTNNPEHIRTNTLYRDQYSGDDLLAVILDTYNDNENALFFHTNPSATRVDIELSNDADGNFLDVANFDWNTYWDVKTTRNEHGWSAEIRIPFSSLGFQVVDGEVEMGLIVYRYIAHNNQVQVYPDISPEHHFYKPSKGAEIELRGVENQNPVYISPYLLGELNQVNELNQNQNGYHSQSELNGNPGIDIKYDLNSNLTLDLTLNTDFAQVEADAQQVNLTRFSLFFPEKRQFFQERASIFSFDLGYRERLFHSRRIGLSDSGEPIPILGGFRLVGRVDDWDIGLLDMQTARQGEIASENFGVARIRKRMFNDYSYMGGMITSRYDVEGNYNIAYGVDGSVNIAGNEYLTIQWSQTYDSGLDESGFPDNSLARFRWERRRQEGFSYFTDVTWAGPDYQPDTGFFLRRDFLKNVGNLTYRFMQDTGSSLRFIESSVPWLAVWRNNDGRIESGFISSRWNVEWKSGATFSVSPEYYFESLLETLVLPEDSNVPPGDYNYTRITAMYGMALSRLFRVNAGLGYGGFFDGRNMEIRFSPTWNISRHVELGGSYTFNHIEFKNRGRAFNTHVVQFQLNTAFNTKTSIRLFTQFNSAEDLVTSNFRFRYNIREGNDLWIVYNENMNSLRKNHSPRLPLSNGRTVLLKYKHTFRW